MKNLDPKSVWLFFLSSAARWLIPVVIATLYIKISSIGVYRGNSPFDNMLSYYMFWILGVFVVFLFLCFVWAKLTYYFYRYELTENGFRKESGVIYKRYVTIPYDRIQNVDIYRGILARILGLSDLQIPTAGASVSYSRYGAGAEGRLPGLQHSVAEQLRDELIQRARQPRNQGL